MIKVTKNIIFWSKPNVTATDFKKTEKLAGLVSLLFIFSQ